MESLFIQLSNDVYVSIEEKKDPYDWSCGPGSHTHIYCNFNLNGCFLISQAYSLVDREVGYCQGSAFIVGLLLMQVCLLMN